MPGPTGTADTEIGCPGRKYQEQPSQEPAAKKSRAHTEPAVPGENTHQLKDCRRQPATAPLHSPSSHESRYLHQEPNSKASA